MFFTESGSSCLKCGLAPLQTESEQWTLRGASVRMAVGRTLPQCRNCLKIGRQIEMFPFWFSTSHSSWEWGRRPIINVSILVKSKGSWKRECLFFFFCVMFCFILRNVAAEVVPGCCAKYPAWICSVFKTRGKAARSLCLWDCLKWLTQQKRPSKRDPAGAHMKSKMPSLTLTASFPSKTLQMLLQKFMTLSTVMEGKDRCFCSVLEKPVESSKATFNIYLYNIYINIYINIYLYNNVSVMLQSPVQEYSPWVTQSYNVLLKLLWDVDFHVTPVNRQPVKPRH